MKLITYLIEVSVIIAVLYLLYRLLFYKETFFNFNRFYLVGVLLIALALPLSKVQLNLNTSRIYYSSLIGINSISTDYHSIMKEYNVEWNTGPGNIVNKEVSSDKGVNKLTQFLTFLMKARFLVFILLAVYFGGLLFFTVKFYIGLYQIRQLRKRSFNTEYEGIKLVLVENYCEPFTYLNTIYLSADLYESDNFQKVFHHERTHVKHQHTFDLIIAQIASIVLWFNPMVWQLQKDLKTTHEYIADKQVIDHGFKLSDYQSLLLNQFIGNNCSAELVHNLNLVSIKKRITMMSKNNSGWLSRLKMLVIIPVGFIAFMIFAEVSCSSEADNVIDDDVTTKSLVAEQINLPEVSYKQTIENNCPIEIEIKESIRINGKTVKSEGDLNEALEIMKEMVPAANDPKATVLLRIDKTVPMEKIDPVFKALRNNNLLKVYFEVNSGNGAGDNITYGIGMRLPPSEAIWATDEILKAKGIAKHTYSIESNQNRAFTGFSGELREFIFFNPKYVLLLNYNNETNYDTYLKAHVAYREVFALERNRRAEKKYNTSFDKLQEEQQKEIKKQYPLVLTMLNTDDPEYK